VWLRSKKRADRLTTLVQAKECTIDRLNVIERYSVTLPYILQGNANYNSKGKAFLRTKSRHFRLCKAWMTGLRVMSLRALKVYHMFTSIWRTVGVLRAMLPHCRPCDSHRAYVTRNAQWNRFLRKFHNTDKRRARSVAGHGI
jgi:hypothetical protein